LNQLESDEAGVGVGWLCRLLSSKGVTGFTLEAVSAGIFSSAYLMANEQQIEKITSINQFQHFLCTSLKKFKNIIVNLS